MNILERYLSGFAKEQKAMAASVESLAYCQKLATGLRVNSILDAGSGLSSVFFHASYDTVTTIDDNQFWADKTTEFIEQNLHKKIQIHPISSVLEKKFDLVFYDYGNIETRIYHFRDVLSMFNKVLYVDDMHVGFYRDYVKSRAEGYDLSIVQGTTDEFGRYGAIISRKGFSFDPMI